MTGVARQPPEYMEDAGTPDAPIGRLPSTPARV